MAAVMTGLFHKSGQSLPSRASNSSLIERFANHLTSLTPAQQFWLIFAIAFLVRAVLVIGLRRYQDLGRYELERTAISLATTGVYGNPYALPTGPTAHVSPGYTLILAAIFRLFGTGTFAEIVKEMLSCAVTAFQCAVMPALVRAFSLDSRVGLLAALLSAVFPAKLLVQTEGDWEAPYTALALMLLATLTVSLWKRRDLTLSNSLLQGAAWGISLLFVSALLGMLALFLVVGLFYFRRNWAPFLRFSFVECLVAFLCLLPWGIRNAYALGSPIFTRSNFGLELRISNNDLASPSEHLNSLNGVYDIYHPLQNRAEAVKVREMGEVAYNRNALNQARQWIRSHPRRFVELTFGRIRWFWLYNDKEHVLKTIFLSSAVILGLAGLFLVFRTQRLTGVVLSLILLEYPLPNYLVHVGLRQKYPIDWIMTLLMCVFLVFCFDRVTHSRTGRYTQSRHIE